MWTVMMVQFWVFVARSKSFIVFLIPKNVAFKYCRAVALARAFLIQIVDLLHLTARIHSSKPLCGVCALGRRCKQVCWLKASCVCRAVKTADKRLELTQCFCFFFSPSQFAVSNRPSYTFPSGLMLWTQTFCTDGHRLVGRRRPVPLS